jgi:hypothetical protein
VSERAAWALAFVCLGSWGAFYLAGVTGARGELNRFGVLRAAAKLRAGSPDQTFWSEERVRAWQSTLSDPDPPPLAVLRVPRIGVEVAVLEGTDDFTLNRAVGHVANTARPGSDGNSAIAAHRDGCRDARWQRGVSRRADLDRRPGGRFGARPDACPVAHAGHLLPVLLHRLGAAAVHVRAVRADEAVSER